MMSHISGLLSATLLLGLPWAIQGYTFLPTKQEGERSQSLLYHQAAVH